ncbi:MAG TPA: hypothetical protein VG934_03340 [Candidatus Paceibacterota bacterium]|nr:hypothetical protein [Candidatus Paceibacterota bacterium]
MQSPAISSVAIDLGTSSGASSTVPSTTPLVRDVPAGQNEYHNDAYHFSVLYPDNLKVAEQDNGASATFTFEDDKNVQGFQLFVQPFSGTQITDAQFKQDDPSGVRDDPQNFTLDGASGVAFYSQDHLLGDTREMWFIRGGFLYEVTTFKEQADWLDQIMQTWKFY